MKIKKCRKGLKNRFLNRMKKIKKKTGRKKCEVSENKHIDKNEMSSMKNKNLKKKKIQ